MVGIETSDDAAVYRVTDSLSVIQTLDFFTPVVDDPYVFGQIAAANALSDVYAMGGEPKLALNIVCFPNCLDPSVLSEIMSGGADKVREAGAVLVGGHSVQDDEPKYGLSVTGFVQTDRILRNTGAKPGDVLILTKPVGSGIINTAAKAQMVSEAHLSEAIRVMAKLNRYAAEAMRDFTIHACTDITGFGLLGHCAEMAGTGDITMELDVGAVPFMEGAKEYASGGLVPAGSYTNRKLSLKDVDAAGADELFLDLLYDPQTSGGLLYSIPEAEAETALKALSAAIPDMRPACIGRVKDAGEKPIRLIT